MRLRLLLTGLFLTGCSAASVSPIPTTPVEQISPAPSADPPVSASPTSLDALPAAIPHQAAASVNQELRSELLAMLAEDQAVRTGVPLPGDDRTAEELFADMANVDDRNSARLHEILDEFGWPGWSLVGRDGSEAAWALAQHADLRPEIQDLALAYLRGAVEADDASPGDLAYLADRVLVRRNLPQIYGTQLGVGTEGELAPRTPIEDEENVDRRRAAAGLGTLEEYFEEFRQAMEEPAAASS
jgi:hypothetical protein